MTRTARKLTRTRTNMQANVIHCSARMHIRPNARTPCVKRMASSVYCECADFGGTEAEARGKVKHRRTRMRTRAGKVSVWGCVYWLPVLVRIFEEPAFWDTSLGPVQAVTTQGIATVHLPSGPLCMDGAQWHLLKHILTNDDPNSLGVNLQNELTRQLKLDKDK